MPKDIKIGDDDFQGVIDLRNNDPLAGRLNTSG